ncbi:MAG: MopE-related protein, partial [Chitinophagales bacterium]
YTIAGTGEAGFSGDNGLAINAKLQNPANICVDQFNNIYFSDKGNNRIRKIDAVNGIITTIAGTGETSFNGDGLDPLSTNLNNPVGITIDSEGSIYIAEQNAHRIRKVTNIACQATEVCDGLDNNCDGFIDEGFVTVTYYADVDSDGFGNSDVSIVTACDAPVGYVLIGGDCNDTLSAIHPDAIEICDGLDNNCDGFIDEGFVTVTYYADVDSDGFGNSDVSIVTACDAPVGYVLIGGDCNDTLSAIHPDAIEICDGLDNNCDGFIDEGFVT